MGEKAIECVKTILSSIENKEFSKAIDLVLKNKDQYRDDIDFIKAQALLCINVEEYETAVELLKKARQLAPHDGQVYYYLSTAYEQIVGTVNKNVIVVDAENKNPVVLEDDLNLYRIRRDMEVLLKSDDDPYVSIVLVGYNNLDRLTKPAVESLLKYTEDIDYELILIDNGSSDGTLEYFKSIPFAKKTIYHITKNLGAFYGYKAAQDACTGRFTKGKYVVNSPNDVIFTKNWLRNMLICAESDEKIGVIVPKTDNCSNYQTVDLGYTDFIDMQKKAAEHNVSDPKKWEERMRVIPFLWVRRQEVLGLIKEDIAFIHNFADDDLSVQYRRAGYKLIVCGDVFIHHEGSSIVAENQDKYTADMEKGREIYRRKYFGIDAWDDICNYEVDLFSVLPIAVCQEKSKIKALGIDVRCGTPLLELKNKLKKNEIWEINLYGFTQNAKYWQDLSSICGAAVVCDRIEYIGEYFLQDDFDYILLGEYINEYEHWQQFLNDMVDKLAKNGMLAFKCKNLYDCYYFQTAATGDLPYKRWIDEIMEHLGKLACEIIKGVSLTYGIESNEKDRLYKHASTLVGGENAKIVLNDLFVAEYVVVVGKK